VVHATIGKCSPRPEPELAQLHRARCDEEGDIDALAEHLLSAHEPGSPLPAVASAS
jgi:hypothetical protein